MSLASPLRFFRTAALSLVVLVVFSLLQTGLAKPPDAIFINGTIETMNPALPKARAVAVTGGKITAVGPTALIETLAGPGTAMFDLGGATMLPGFIDSHSHVFGYGIFTDKKNWIDVSSVNVYFKPLPGDPRCTTPTDPQNCFIPVQTQDDVIQRLKNAVANATPEAPVLAFNYDPSRLGNSPACQGSRVGFACANFEDGHAREYLDQISTTVPIFVASESGHIAYVNTPALTMLNICGTSVANPVTCTNPATNPLIEVSLAEKGQLDEDLAVNAAGFFAGLTFQADPLLPLTSLLNAVAIYQQHGYTLIQEGLAGPGELEIYPDATKLPDFPVTAAMVVGDLTTPDFSQTIAEAIQAREANKGNPKLIIAAVKTFADGSTQGYTAFLNRPYKKVFSPFKDPPFPQPYKGLPDLPNDSSDPSEAKNNLAELVKSRAIAAHAAGFPLVVHQNGDAAIGGSIKGLRQAQQILPSRLRDLVLHAPLITRAEMEQVADLNATVSFLTENLYYYGLMLCHQVIGSRALSAYPAGSAFSTRGLNVSLHPDSPVTPPYPLFSIWVAKTRQTQQPSWYPNTNPQRCPVVMGPEEAISIRQGIRAYTLDAARQYGLEEQLGSIEAGKTADFVILSDNPLDMEHNPGRLKTIRVIATVSHGRYFANPNADQTPIWPE